MGHDGATSPITRLPLRVARGWITRSLENAQRKRSLENAQRTGSSHETERAQCEVPHSSRGNGYRIRKHHGTMYVGHGRSVPCTNGPIKRSSLAEHKLHAGQGRGVPCTNGLIECRSNPCTDGLVNAAASPHIRLMVVTVEVFYAPVG